MYDEAEKIINRYIEIEKKTLAQIEQLNYKDGVGTTKWRLKNIYIDRIELLEDLKRDICG